jgi:type IV secretory pathway component VirB8
MENEILELVKKNEEKLEKIYISTEKTRKYIFWTMMITVIFLVLPIIGLVVAIPSFMSTYSSVSSIGGI